MTMRPKDLAELDPNSMAIRRMLGLDVHANAFQVVYGATATNDKEIAILSRSMMQVLATVAMTIDVPQAHVADRRVSPTPEAEQGPDGPIAPLIQFVSSSERPKDAAIAVSYRGYWFWIDDRDILSKRIFTFLLFAFAMVDTGGKGQAPVLTIPTQ
jgi:hypothetical protein